MKKFVLASSSPRRKMLLEQLGLTLSICKPEVEEAHQPAEPPQDYVLRNAELKLLDVVRRQGSDCFVLAADTIVEFQNEILEKPKSAQEAFSMLRRIQGNEHTVRTGVGVAQVENGQLSEKRIFSCASKVILSPLSDQQISWYVATQEPLDKAGSYGAQGIGAAFIEKIEGSYSNVVGLPLNDVRQCLQTVFSFDLLS